MLIKIVEKYKLIMYNINYPNVKKIKNYSYKITGDKYE